MNVPLTYVLVILTGHWVGDYLLQTNRIAKEKSQSLLWLVLHVALYTLVLTSFSFFMFPLSTAIQFIFINSVLHFITDFFTSRLCHRFQSRQRLYYIIIGLDQMIHTMTLLSTCYFLMR